MEDKQSIFEKIMADEFLKLMKDINTQVQNRIAYTEQNM